MATTSNYLGRVPRAVGTGPKNLPKTSPAQTRMPRVRPSAARTSRVRPGLASGGGVRPPAGAGSGIAKATTPMASTPKRYINKPKTGRPGRGLGNPRADMPARI